MITMRPFRVLLPALFTLLISGCTAQDSDHVDVRTLQTEIAAGGIQLVDVRTPQEWSTGHIAGAVHIDWFRDDFKAEVAKLDKTRPVRLYCAAGGRSEEAGELLREMGFTDVRDLDGGVAAWKKAGAPVVR